MAEIGERARDRDIGQGQAISDQIAILGGHRFLEIVEDRRQIVELRLLRRFHVAGPTDIRTVLETARDTGATTVGRAALGLFWLAGPADADWVAKIREALAPRACSIVDGAGRLPDGVDIWPAPDAGALTVMRRVKARFDPARVFRPGTFVGGI